MLDNLDNKLDQFNDFNNAKRIADLRKHCHTHTSKNSIGISSRLLTSGVSGGTINPTTRRLHQSVSDVDVNSLITVEDNVGLITN
jgi:hypothetical protein